MTAIAFLNALIRGFRHRRTWSSLFQVMNAQYNFEIPQMFAAILLLALLGLSANAALVTLQRRLCRWADVTN